MPIQPLPHPTRLIGGEGIGSYAPRAAARNGAIVDDIETALREAGLLTRSKARSHPLRLQAWRELGALHESAFTAPEIVAGNWVIDRPACIQCSAGVRSTGKRPDLGWVCVSHKRWLDGKQVALQAFPEALAAERHLRRVLVPRGVVVESPVMRLAEECAIVGISRATFEERASRVTYPSPPLLIYPETVRMARLLTRRSFLDLVCDPGVPGRQRRFLVEGEVTRILPGERDTEAWRAVNRVWAMVTDLSDLIRDAALVDRLPEDAQYNVLRLSRFVVERPVEPVEGVPTFGW
ncbi:hypothetical protein GCM10009811_08370 [Nostocoides veronense]|uniref:Restriction endonuclease n=1 Tax=Nostocoides veronense TaxID=330836 RepID=A0ABP4XQZ0_9MICO